MRSYQPFLEPEQEEALYIRNDRAHEITVRIVDASMESNTDIPPGGFQGFNEGIFCEATLIEAQDENGRVLARVNSVACTTQTWIIAEDGTATFVPGRAEPPK
ncbi:hypothetical protein GCM10009682_47100 [Luedemannella flava]|uniref:Uncharacterized protein n=1 Tax=Luedemannella flava TaxID=349316 RepID=A0ABN2MD02_9ACTN